MLGTSATQFSKTKEENVALEDILLEFSNQLVVWNDEVNTFDWVIESLVELCDHTEEQAEQCALFIHFNGKYPVKKGSYSDLKPICDALTDRGIQATIH